MKNIYLIINKQLHCDINFYVIIVFKTFLLYIYMNINILMTFFYISINYIFSHDAN